MKVKLCLGIIVSFAILCLAENDESKYKLVNNKIIDRNLYDRDCYYKIRSIYKNIKDDYHVKDLCIHMNNKEVADYYSPPDEIEIRPLPKISYCEIIEIIVLVVVIVLLRVYMYMVVRMAKKCSELRERSHPQK